MKQLLSVLIVVVAFSGASAAETFTGVVTDSMCPMGDHSRMRMGATDGDCARACVSAHGAAFVLFDGKTAYVLKGQQPPARFAGQKVRVVGTLDGKTKTIQVESIAAAR